MDILVFANNSENTLTLTDNYNTNAKDREIFGTFEYGDLTIAFMECITKEVNRHTSDISSPSFYDLKECTYKGIFSRVNKQYQLAFDLFSDTPITARQPIYDENTPVPPEQELQEGFIDFCFNLEQSIRSRNSLTLYRRQFKSREASVLAADSLESWVQTPSVFSQVKRDEFSNRSGIVCENDTFNVEPRTFSCFFEYDNNFNIRIGYKIKSIMELIALDYICFLSSPTITGTIGICLNCKKIFKASRSDAIYCRQSCGAKSQAQNMTEYEKKYRHYRKMSSLYLPGIECKEFRKKWRDEALALLDLIKNCNLHISPKEYGQELKNKLDAYCKLNNTSGGMSK